MSLLSATDTETSLKLWPWETRPEEDERRARGGNRGLGFRFSGRAGDLKLGRIAISDQAYYIIKYYFYYKLRMGFSQNSIE